MSAVAGLVANGATTADVSVLNTPLTPLSGSSFQLNTVFSLLCDVELAYYDTTNDNLADLTLPTGLEGVGTVPYSDPQNYILDFALPGSGTALRPFFRGEELTAAATVDWRLSYSETPGDSSTIYTTIMSGSADSVEGGLTLNIADQFMWLVNGSADSPDVPPFTHVAIKIADVASLSFTYPGAGGPATLAANVIPAPGVLALMGLCGLGVRRRRG